MSLVVTCNKCGQTISLRKMPHGRHVPFDLSTNSPHKCGSRKSSKGKGAEVGGRRASATKAAKVQEVETELPLPLQSSDKGAFSRESTTKYDEFFATATPPKAPDALPLNIKEGPSGARPWVWAVLSALITALFFSLYFNLTAKPKVIVVEKRVSVLAQPTSQAQGYENPSKDPKSEQSEDDGFVPDPVQQR